MWCTASSSLWRSFKPKVGSVHLWSTRLHAGVGPSQRRTWTSPRSVHPRSEGGCSVLPRAKALVLAGPLGSSLLDAPFPGPWCVSFWHGRQAVQTRRKRRRSIWGGQNQEFHGFGRLVMAGQMIYCSETSSGIHGLNKKGQGPYYGPSGVLGNMSFRNQRLVTSYLCNFGSRPAGSPDPFSAQPAALNVTVHWGPKPAGGHLAPKSLWIDLSSPSMTIRQQKDVVKNNWNL